MSAVETTASVSARRRARRGRSLWWRVHQWAGLQASLYLTFVLVTGTLAVLAHEIDWLLRPAMWVAPTEVEERVSWGTVTKAVTAHAPDAQVLMLSAPLHAASAFDAVIVRDGERRHVYVHPRTGTVTGEGAWMSVQRFLRDAHRRLMLFQTFGGVRIGIVLVCLSSVLLLLSLVTSFWVYKKWWRGYLRWPRGRDARSLTGDTHRFMGLWSLWFVVVITWTGL
ncbi:MAG: PepSY-associated TM helix domain-containing protein, partial [Pseudomonadales bacterium]